MQRSRSVSTKAVQRALYTHVDRCFPVHDKAMIALEGHPVLASLPHLRVARIAPSYGSEPWAFLTLGGWALGREAGGGTELLLLAEDDREVHARTLADALLQLEEHPVAPGAFVRLPGGWLPGSACDHGLVTLPYPYGPVLEEVRDSPLPVRVLWLCPVTAAEVALGRTQGLEALEQRLEGMNFQDPQRPSRA